MPGDTPATQPGATKMQGADAFLLGFTAFIAGKHITEHAFIDRIHVKPEDEGYLSDCWRQGWSTANANWHRIAREVETIPRINTSHEARP